MLNRRILEVRRKRQRIKCGTFSLLYTVFNVKINLLSLYWWILMSLQYYSILCLKIMLVYYLGVRETRLFAFTTTKMLQKSGSVLNRSSSTEKLVSWSTVSWQRAALMTKIPNASKWKIRRISANKDSRELYFERTVCFLPCPYRNRQRSDKFQMWSLKEYA